MALPNTFAAQTTPVMASLDENFTAVGNMGIYPCTVSGTDDLVLTQIAAKSPTLTAYAAGMRFAGVAVSTNTVGVTARVGSLAILNVYKDSPAGPVTLVAKDLFIGNAFTLLYDSALNSGAGGFHFIGTTFTGGGGTINGPVVMLNTLSVASLASVTKLMVGASAASISRILSAAGTLTYTVVPANTTQQQTLAVPGAQINDVVSVGPPASVVTGTHFMGYVLAAGTVAVVAINPTAASLTPLGGIYRVAVTGFT